MSFHLEINHNTGNAGVIRTNADGFVTHEVIISQSTSHDEVTEQANALGWTVGADWWPSGDHEIALLEPTPVWVSFVGHVPENAIELARGAGVMATGIVSQEDLPEQGKVRVQFDVELPKGWLWQDVPDWVALSDEEETVIQQG